MFPCAVTYEVLETPFYNRAGEFVTSVPRYESLWRSLSNNAANVAPTIDVWYGETQNFAKHGTPQEWINLLGNVSDADGNLTSLSYKLNGGAQRPLAFGGDGSFNDGRRLWNAGDFNIEIDKDELLDGNNQIVITAQDVGGLQSQSQVTLNYDDDSTWPIPYDVNWSTVAALEDAVQVVDGKWSYSSAGARPVERGYDRILAIGEGSFNGGGWTEFEVQVEVTIHGYDEAGYVPPNTAPAVGLVARWQGATDYKYPGCQPKCGWLPVGAVAWYSWAEQPGDDDPYFVMWSNESGFKAVPNHPIMIENQTYYWKMRVENVKEPTGTYYFKMWEKGTAEPNNWLATFDESMLAGSVDMLESGSILLLSHHVDVTFGDIQIRPVNNGQDKTPPQIGDVKVIPEANGATVRWTTNEPASGTVDFGQTESYGQTITADHLATSHTVYIPGLKTDASYFFMITATDLAENSSKTGGDTFKTQKLIKLVSDDFNVCELDSAWTFIDPLADASYILNTNQVEIHVPAGSNHDIWPSNGLPLNRAPRIMREVTDPDGLKVKFEGNFGGKTALQGVLVEQDAGNFLRASYYHQDGQLKLAVIGYAPGQNKVLKTVTLSNGDLSGPSYLLLERESGRWFVSYSQNGSTWQKIGPFDWPLSVTRAGVFAGNYGEAGQEPEFTGLVDFYFDSQNPISPEDGQSLLLPVSVEGKGKVTKNKECGNPIILTAVPDPGWRFSYWEGRPLEGEKDSTVTASFSHGDSVKAVFVEGKQASFLPLLIWN